jgi:hypothetical protein
MRLLLVQKRFCKIELKEEKKKQNHEQSDGICVFFHWDEFSFSTTTITYLTNFLRCFSIYTPLFLFDPCSLGKGEEEEARHHTATSRQQTYHRAEEGMMITHGRGCVYS